MASCSRSCVGRRGIFICVGLPLFARKHGVHSELQEGQAGWKWGLLLLWGVLGVIYGYAFPRVLRQPHPTIPSSLPQTL